jgi:gmma-aminobutyric acid receptor subunit gamma
VRDLRRQQKEHDPIHIDGAAMERMKNFTKQGCGEEELRRLNKFHLALKTLTNFYRCKIESTWYDNCTVHSYRALKRVVLSAQHITGGTLSALQDIYSTRCHRKAKKIIKDLNHQSHGLFTPLPSCRWRQYRCHKAGTEKLKN